MNKGFTLLELLVVIAIVGLMTAVITVNANAARIQSRDAKRKAELSNVAAALEIYYSEKSPRAYPAAVAWDWNSTLKTALYPTYLPSWPKDPNGTDGTFGSGFVYKSNADKTLYVLDAALEGAEEETNTDIVCENSADPKFYLSGTKKCGAKIHFRLSPR